MHQVHTAGEKLFVDYAGLTVSVVDRVRGERWEAQIFVATLGASSYTYAEATASRVLPDWIASHVRAFAFFGGVPEPVVPDNLKAGVTSACYYEPDLNPSHQELARHSGTVILPARVRKPRDKDKVENGVHQVERWVLARSGTRPSSPSPTSTRQSAPNSRPSTSVRDRGSLLPGGSSSRRWTSRH